MPAKHTAHATASPKFTVSRIVCAGLVAASCGLFGLASESLCATASTAADLADCASCHMAEAASFEDDADGLASKHATLGQDCTACHDTSDRGFVIVHKKTDGKALPTELKRTKASAEACPTCHDAEDLAKATEDVRLVDEKGTEVNPHELPSNESHDALTCFSCHAFHGVAGAKDTDDAAADTDASDAAGRAEDTKAASATYDEARSLCISCHHAGVYECGTCH